ncbi:MAG: DUF2779 domain-containing protein [Deltaproteobacteria bacterium]|nr:DUF2779 domain-containing protein [Deltaproteobacteria bacterium]
MARNLSKSKYLSGLQCEKRLWLEINDPDRAAPVSELQQRLFDQGKEVGELARSHFPGGYLIYIDRSRIFDSARETEKAISRGENVIFEASFIHDDTIVLCDIIAKNDDGTWDIIEVKSAGEVKPEYIPDIAVQKYVAEGSGLTVRKTKIMYINKECVYPNLSNLFLTEDITEEVRQLIEEVSANIRTFKELVMNEVEPEIVIGPHCSSPYECPFIEYCWRDVGDRSVFQIPNFSLAKKMSLRERGILLIDHIPHDFPLSHNQRDYVSRRLTGRTYINKKLIREMLSQLEFPIHFLDFEADNPTVPRLHGMRPFQLIVFQLSCHILNEDGRLEHFEYLHVDMSDPREGVIERLINIVNKKGPVVVYNASFERRVINELASAFPNYKAELGSINSRLWDQLNIFKSHYKHPGFGPSNSLKCVLPVLVPHLNYQELNVSDGTEAQVFWNTIIRTDDDEGRGKMINDLKEYCTLDTLGMVEIHKFLQSLI